VTAAREHILSGSFHTPTNQRICFRGFQDGAVAVAKSFDNDLISRAAVEDVFVARGVHYRGPDAVNFLDRNSEVSKLTSLCAFRIDDRDRGIFRWLRDGLACEGVTAVTASALGAGLAALTSQPGRVRERPRG
jgi:hypothetical protein